MSNRDKATLIWVGAALAFALAHRETRGSLWACAKAFASPKILGPLILFGGWTAGLVVVAHAVRLWESDVESDTVAWFITVGVALFFSLNKVAEPGFFRKTARRAVAVTAVVEGFANLQTLGLVAELILLPVMAVLAALLLVSERKDQFAPVRALLNGFLAIIGVSVLVYVLISLAGNFDAGHTLRALALPVWLTIGSVPIAYAFALVAEYEQAFMLIDFRTEDQARRRRAKRALVRAAHVRLPDLAGFAGHWIWDLALAESDADARAVMRRWRGTWRAEQRAQRERDARAYMEEWLTQGDAPMAEIHGDSLRRTWERLDGEQRATLKAECVRRAPEVLASEIRALPD